MKKLLSALLSLVLLTQLAACGSRLVKLPTQPFDTALLAQLVEGDTFSEALEPLDSDLIWILYDLDASGAKADHLTDAAGYCSTGATCEQALVLCFSAKESADAAYAHLDHYLSQQVEANRSYRPNEVPKLEKAILSQRENTLFLLVAADYDTAGALINQ